MDLNIVIVVCIAFVFLLIVYNLIKPKCKNLIKKDWSGIQNATKKGTMPVRNWSLTIFQLSIYFEGRLDITLNL